MKKNYKRPFVPWKSKYQSVKEKPTFTSDGASSSSTICEDVMEVGALNQTSDIPGWSLYFYKKDSKKEPKLVEFIDLFESHFTNYDHWYNIDEVATKWYLDVNCENILNDKLVSSRWPTFMSDLRNKPTDILACAGIAVYKILTKKTSERSMKKVFIRPTNFKPITNLNSIHNSYGKLITIVGSIMTIDRQSYEFKWMCFRCSVCSAELVVRQYHWLNELVRPSSCRKGCKARGNFIEAAESPFTIVYPKQKITLQDALCKDLESHKPLEVVLTQNLVNKYLPGTQVSVTGMLKFYKKDNRRAFQNKSESDQFTSFFLAISMDEIGTFITNRKMEMSEEDMNIIHMVKASESPFRLLVHSLCPEIRGQETVKAGLILGMISGNNMMKKKRRSTANILMVGNPGTGKSKLLQSCAELAPKSIFVCATNCSSSGLVAKIGAKGKFTAGAFSLCDGGCCCIDELDKNSSIYPDLINSMEQQNTRISKSGVCANFVTKFTVLAAANPCGSMYDMSKTIAENLRKIYKPLLARFDLIHILTATPSISYSLNTSSNWSQRSGTSASCSFFESSNNDFSDRKTWLKIRPNEKIDPLSNVDFQTYVGYARFSCFPILSKEAACELRSFFLEMVKIVGEYADSLMSPRILESLVRLTLARARADLVNEATKLHAIDVIEIFKSTQIDIYHDDAEAISAIIPQTQRSVSATGLSIPKQMKVFTELLESKQDLFDRNSFSISELKEFCKELGITRTFDEIIFRLNNAGYLIKTSVGYQIV